MFGVDLWRWLLGSMPIERSRTHTYTHIITRMPQEQMPGHPPASLQRLFHMGRRLRDSEPLGPLFEDSPLALPVILDMAPPIECVLGWVGWSMGFGGGGLWNYSRRWRNWGWTDLLTPKR